MTRGINVGCGASPTQGFLNFDNSLTVRLASLPLGLAARSMLARALDTGRRKFLERAIEYKVRWAEATHLPVPDQSADVVYASHMLEHLSQENARRFLREALRVLSPGGVIRIVVPDLKILIERYRISGDANQFVANTVLATERPDTLSGRLRLLATGFRDHRWIYDQASLSKLLLEVGFLNPKQLLPGETTIADPGSLDLSERADESLYVEAVRGG